MTLPGALDIASALVCFFAGALSMMLARAPRWREQQWFALTAFSAGLFGVFVFPTTVDGLSMGARFAFGAVAVAAANLTVLGWVMLSRIHLRRAVSKLDRVLLVLLLGTIPLLAIPNVAIRFAILPVPFPLLSTTYRLLQPNALGAMIYALDCFGVLLALYRYASGVRELSGRARTIVFGLVVFMLAAANDAMVGLGLYRGPQLLMLAYLLPVATVVMTQAERLVRSARDLDELSARLEREIASRSQALLDTRRLLDRSARLAAIGRLAAGVAHEVNNPTAAVKGNLHYLKHSLETTGLPADANLCIDESLTSLERIARIVRELCDSARAASTAIEAQPVLLLDAAKAAQAAVRHMLGAGALLLDIPADMRVLASEGHLVQVLTNLLSNGVQATKPGQTAQITVRAENVDERIRITVEDRGAGMSPETLKRLFEPFFTTKPIGQGTGLGLAVSRGLAQAMGGALTFESTLGEGTRALLELGAASSLDARHTPAPARLSEIRSRRMLLVDDDPEVRAGVSRMLRKEFDVEVAASVQEGLVKALVPPHPDFLLCEVMMDDGGGRQLHNLLAASHPELARRIIFLLGGSLTPEITAFQAQQSQPVLHKPLDLAALREAIRGLEAQRRDRVA